MSFLDRLLWNAVKFVTSNLRVRKHLPKSVTTAKGHLDQQWANLQSTTPQHNDTIVRTESTASQDKIAEDVHPTITTPPSIRSHCIYAIYAICASITGQVYTGPSGRFLVPSSRGKNYGIPRTESDSRSY
jgi:hypothetical protein